MSLYVVHVPHQVVAPPHQPPPYLLTSFTENRYFISPVGQVVAPQPGEYDHVGIARRVLKAAGITPAYYEEAYTEMFKLGYSRVVEYPRERLIYAELGGRPLSPRPAEILGRPPCGDKISNAQRQHPTREVYSLSQPNPTRYQWHPSKTTTAYFSGLRTAATRPVPIAHFECSSYQECPSMHHNLTQETATDLALEMTEWLPILRSCMVRARTNPKKINVAEDQTTRFPRRIVFRPDL